MTTAVVRPTVVGLGEIAVSTKPEDVLVSLGLGSCVCIAAFDPKSGVAGMAHIVLPDSGGKEGRQSPKFADVAIPELFKQMQKAGATINKLVLKLAGGAHMMLVAAPDTSQMNIGDRNIEAVKDLLKEAGHRVSAEDLGGTQGRTVRLTVGTGSVTVSRAGQDQKDL
jgi:chemotaxis protein CheD